MSQPQRPVGILRSNVELEDGSGPGFRSTFSETLRDRYHLLEMQAPLVQNPTNASQPVNPTVNARGYGGVNMNLRGYGDVFEHYAEGAGFISESDDVDSENDAISIFSGISTASGGDDSDHSDGAHSDCSAASIPCPADGSVLKEDDATVSGSQSVGNTSSLPVAEDSRVTI